MGLWVVRRTRRLWSDDEKRSICVQTTAPDVSVAQVGRRYGLNANLIFKWVRDPRFAPGAAHSAAQAPCFLPVEIVDHARHEAPRRNTTEGQIEVELAGGQRLRISGSYDPETLARLIRGLSG
ncbi:COG2963 Transposase and inactivated derivatives [Paracoccaceae bacterium]|jgi:transposase